MMYENRNEKGEEETSDETLPDDELKELESEEEEETF